MTTHYVRDESGFRELSQRYRVGSPVLISPALTRSEIVWSRRATPEGGLKNAHADIPCDLAPRS